MVGIIFDLDGVLVHTDELHYRAWKKLADRIGVEFNREINNRLRGVSRMDSLEIILERYTGAELNKQALAEEKNTTYCNLLQAMSPADVTDEARQTLVALRKMGARLAIGSSSRNAKFILQRTALIDYFDAISDGNNITNSKPDPEVFVKAAQMLGLEAQRCLVIEDAAAGIDAAKAGGFYAVAMNDAKNYSRADASISSLSEIIKIAGNR